MQTEACIIVLAAGSGSRFRGKGHKLAQSLASDSVLGLTLAHALATQLPVVVVVTEALAPLARTLVAARDVVVMPEVGSQPGLGMGTSIAAGVGARPQADGWLVLPGDMPLVRPATLLAVARELPSDSLSANSSSRRAEGLQWSQRCDEEAERSACLLSGIVQFLRVSQQVGVSVGSDRAQLLRSVLLKQAANLFGKPIVAFLSQHGAYLLKRYRYRWLRYRFDSRSGRFVRDVIFGNRAR